MGDSGIFTRHEAKNIRKAFGHQFGNRAISTVSRIAAASIEAERIKLRELEEKQFKAYQSCPKCYAFDFHLISEVTKKAIIRQCNFCNHKWGQK